MLKKSDLLLFSALSLAVVAVAVSSWPAVILSISILVYEYASIKNVSRETFDSSDILIRLEALETKTAFKNTLGGR